MTEELYSVYLIFPNGTNHPEAQFVSAERAVLLAKECTTRPAALIGMIAEVMITDSGDCCCFHWKHGEGIVFPTEEMRRDVRQNQGGA